MARQEDSDMKICPGRGGGNARNRFEDSGAMARLLDREKKNGNLSKARRLGARMAGGGRVGRGIFYCAAGPAASVPAAPCQRRIPMAFLPWRSGWMLSCPTTWWAVGAERKFYDTPEDPGPDFYADLQESGAFSFYYLCVRDGRQVERRVEKFPASLCGRPGSESYARMGRSSGPASSPRSRAPDLWGTVHLRPGGWRNPLNSPKTRPPERLPGAGFP